jgi:hypothetical protein
VLLFSGLVFTRYKAEGDGKPVPSVDGDDRQRQGHQLFLGKALLGLFIHRVGNVAFPDQSDRFCQRQRSALAVSIETPPHSSGFAVDDDFQLWNC